MDTTTITIYRSTYREHVAMSYVYGIEDALTDIDPNRARWVGWEASAFGRWFAERQDLYDGPSTLIRAWEAYNRRVSLIKSK